MEAENKKKKKRTCEQLVQIQNAQWYKDTCSREWINGVVFGKPNKSLTSLWVISSAEVPCVTIGFWRSLEYTIL